MGFLSFKSSVAENVFMTVTTRHKMCFLCCCNLTHKQHRFRASAKQCRPGYRKTCITFHPFIEQEVKVFQMFRALPYIKPHPVPGLRLPFSGKDCKIKDSALFKQI